MEPDPTAADRPSEKRVAEPSPEEGAAAKRAAAYWTEHHRDAEARAADDFMAHPMVRAYLTMRAVGTVLDPIDIFRREIERRTDPGARVLSVGSGLGHNERALAHALPDRTFVGMDIADEIVASANEAARREALTNVEFYGGDFNQLDLEPNEFDLVAGIAAIHHVEQLERFWASCRRGLRPGGVVLAQEYLGADRFQWPDAQLAAGTHALEQIVPEEHKVHHRTVECPPLELMLREDPSEAVRSSEILSTCREAGFSITQFAGAGGSLLHPVLMYQVSTFDPSNWRHNRTLAELFEAEDRLIAEGVLAEDFAMFVAE